MNVLQIFSTFMPMQLAVILMGLLATYVTLDMVAVAFPALLRNYVKYLDVK